MGEIIYVLGFMEDSREDPGRDWTSLGSGL